MELYDSLVRKNGNISEEEWKEYADNYIGHPQDIDEDISITNERNAYIDGFKCAKEKLEIEYFERFKEARQEDKEKLIAEACKWLEENAKLYSDDIAINCLLANFKVGMEDLK